MRRAITRVEYTLYLLLMAAPSAFSQNNGTTCTSLCGVGISNANVNYTPVALPHVIQLSGSSGVLVSLIASDANNDSLTYGLLTAPLGGSITSFNTNTGQFTYTPQFGFAGIDGISFVASDGLAVSEAATITFVSSSAGGQIVLSPSTMSFPSENVGTSSSSQSIALQNTGPVALDVPTITIQGGNPSDFTISNGCQLTITAGDSCTFGVTFMPTTVGTRTATIVVSDGNAINSPQSVSVSGPGTATQAIIFTPLASPVVFALPPVLLSATGGGSGNPIIFNVISGPGVISGNMLTLLGVGTIVIAADQAGNNSYSAAAQAMQTLVVSPATPAIGFTVPNHTYGDAAFLLAATSNSTGQITYSVIAGPASLSNSTVTLTGTGTVVLQASQAAAGNYTSGTQTAMFTVMSASQAITFVAPSSPVNYGVSPMPLSGNASSGLPLVFTVISGPATISGRVLSITGAGPIIVAADQAGNANYKAASQITQSIVVNRAILTVAAGSPTTVYGQPIPGYTASYSGFQNGDTNSVMSGGPSLTTSPAMPSSAGTYTITAALGTLSAANYSFTFVAGTLTISQASQGVNFPQPTSPVTFGISPIVLNASATSGLAVAYRVLSGPATVIGSTVTIGGAGTIVVAASQAGNANYVPATQVIRSIAVNKFSPAMGLTASLNPVLVQNAVTLAATVGAAVATPTGSVIFSDNGTTLGTVNLNSGVATLTISTLTIGSHAITAIYSGDSNFSPVTSAVLGETVQDFTLATGGNGSSQIVSPGLAASYTFILTPSGGKTFPATLGFSNSGLVPVFTSTFAPSSLPAGSGTTTVVMTVQVPPYAMLDRGRNRDRRLPLVAFALLLMPFLVRARRSGRISGMFVSVLLVLTCGGIATLFVGCGGSRSYSFTVTASSGTLSHSTDVTLIVQ